MAATLTIFLFDVDGVLVEPLAYKLGISKTLEILCDQIGVKADSLLPSADEIAFMEARGIHDVWDITNIVFALILMNVCKSLKAQEAGLKFEGEAPTEWLEEIKSNAPSSVERPDYKGFTDSITDQNGSTHPPDQALVQLDKQLEPLFDDTSKWRKLFRSFLELTRSPLDSFGTCTFQNVILGSEAFRESYGLPVTYNGPPLLNNDEVLLDKKWAERINENFRTNGQFAAGIFTARPSTLPQENVTFIGYSPEAEMAARLVGLRTLPLVGMGMMEWLGHTFEVRSEDLTKPNTTHFMAALLAAFNRKNSYEILERAYKLDKRRKIKSNDFWELYREKVEIFVFEDTSSGIKPALAVTEKLRSGGFSISVTPLGIAKDEAKKAALSTLCESVFPDINEALDYAWQKAGLKK